jgi:hypothetical protein
MKQINCIYGAELKDNRLYIWKVYDTNNDESMRRVSMNYNKADKIHASEIIIYDLNL